MNGIESCLPSVGKAPRLGDGGAEFFLGFVIARRQVAHSAGVRDGGAEPGLAEPHHGPADDGIFDAEHLGNGGFKKHWFLLGLLVPSRLTAGAAAARPSGASPRPASTFPSSPRLVPCSIAKASLKQGPIGVGFNENSPPCQYFSSLDILSTLDTRLVIG